MSDFLKKNCVKSDSNRLSYCKHCRCGFSVDKAALKSYLVGRGNIGGFGWNFGCSSLVNIYYKGIEEQ